VIRALSADEAVASAGKLADFLLDCIAGGASVSFMLDFSRAEAMAYWRSIATEVGAGRRVLFAAGDVDVRRHVDLLQGAALSLARSSLPT